MKNHCNNKGYLDNSQFVRKLDWSLTLQGVVDNTHLVDEIKLYTQKTINRDFLGNNKYLIKYVIFIEGQESPRYKLQHIEECNQKDHQLDCFVKDSHFNFRYEKHQGDKVETKADSGDKEI